MGKRILPVIFIMAIAWGGYQYFRIPAKSLADQTVDIYTMNDCPGCDQARNYFYDLGIEYNEYNINDTQANLEKFKTKKSKLLPLIVFGENRVQGFDEAKLNVVARQYYQTHVDDKSVILFSMAKCRYCDMARKLFMAHQVKFKEYDIGDEKNQKVFNILGGKGTPFILIGSRHILGFDKTAILEALKTNGLI